MLPDTAQPSASRGPSLPRRCGAHWQRAAPDHAHSPHPRRHCRRDDHRQWPFRRAARPRGMGGSPLAPALRPDALRRSTGERGRRLLTALLVVLAIAPIVLAVMTLILPRSRCSSSSGPRAAARGLLERARVRAGGAPLEGPGPHRARQGVRRQRVEGARDRRQRVARGHHQRRSSSSPSSTRCSSEASDGGLGARAFSCRAGNASRPDRRRVLPGGARSDRRYRPDARSSRGGIATVLRRRSVSREPLLLGMLSVIAGAHPDGRSDDRLGTRLRRARAHGASEKALGLAALCAGVVGTIDSVLRPWLSRRFKVRDARARRARLDARRASSGLRRLGPVPRTARPGSRARCRALPRAAGVAGGGWRQRERRYSNAVVRCRRRRRRGSRSAFADSDDTGGRPAGASTRRCPRRCLRCVGWARRAASGVTVGEALRPSARSSAVEVGVAAIGGGAALLAIAVAGLVGCGRGVPRRMPEIDAGRCNQNDHRHRRRHEGERGRRRRLPRRMRARQQDMRRRAHRVGYANARDVRDRGAYDAFVVAPCASSAARSSPAKTVGARLAPVRTPFTRAHDDVLELRAGPLSSGFTSFGRFGTDLMWRRHDDDRVVVRGRAAAR